MLKLALVREPAFLCLIKYLRRKEKRYGFCAEIIRRTDQKAKDNGAFEGLSGFGKPLPKDDAAHVPEELRMGYRIMKNAGFAGEETALKKNS